MIETAEEYESILKLQAAFLRPVGCCYHCQGETHGELIHPWCKRKYLDERVGAWEDAVYWRRHG